MSLRVYAYSGCSTCRSAVQWLREHGIAHEVIPIREQPPTVPELRTMLGHAGGELRKLFNTSGRDYQTLGLKDRLLKMSTEEALALLAQNGNLVKRPFAFTEQAGTVGFKPEVWQRRFASS